VAWLLQSSKTLRNAGPHSVVGLLFSFQRPNFSHHKTSTSTPLVLPRFSRGPEDLFRSAVGSFYRLTLGNVNLISACFRKASSVNRTRRGLNLTSLLPSLSSSCWRFSSSFLAGPARLRGAAFTASPRFRQAPWRFFLLAARQVLPTAGRCFYLLRPSPVKGL
jgi:hypothetical protein